jgi:FlaA1/EpsC-like NDP-sugar epimerase
MDYEPKRVLLLDNNESGLHDLLMELQAKHPKIEIVPLLADITRMPSLRPVFTKYTPQVIFHAAAYKHVPMLQYHPLEALRVNTLGTLNVAELAVAFRVERFVLISTDKAVHPSSVMGASKRACELLLHALVETTQRRTLFTAVRFGNVLNSRGSVVPTFERQIAAGGPVTVTDREMTRYFMSIPEAVNLIIHAACLTNGDDIFILRMGEVVRIVELAERMIRLHGLRPYQDIRIDFTGVRPGEKMHEELFSQDEKPESTLHPGIIKLDTWHEAFDGEDFLQQMRELIEDEALAADATCVLDRLHALIKGRRKPTNGAHAAAVEWVGDVLETQH